MPRFQITEIAVYEVEAPDEDRALDLYLEHGPAIDGDGIEQPVEFVAITEREIEEVKR